MAHWRYGASAARGITLRNRATLPYIRANVALLKTARLHGPRVGVWIGARRARHHGRTASRREGRDALSRARGLGSRATVFG